MLTRYHAYIFSKSATQPQAKDLLGRLRKTCMELGAFPFKPGLEGKPLRLKEISRGMLSRSTELYLVEGVLVEHTFNSKPARLETKIISHYPAKGDPLDFNEDIISLTARKLFAGIRPIYGNGFEQKLRVIDSSETFSYKDPLADI